MFFRYAVSIIYIYTFFHPIYDQSPVHLDHCAPWIFWRNQWLEGFQWGPLNPMINTVRECILSLAFLSNWRLWFRRVEWAHLPKKMFQLKNSLGGWRGGTVKRAYINRLLNIQKEVWGQGSCINSLFKRKYGDSYSNRHCCGRTRMRTPYLWKDNHKQHANEATGILGAW